MVGVSNMRKTMVLLLLCTIIMTTMLLPTTSTATTKTFYDVSPKHWSYEAISWAVGKGIVYGNPNGSFLPANIVTEAEFLAMLIRAFGTDYAQFMNSQTSHWAEPYYLFSEQKNYKVYGISNYNQRKIALNRLRVAEIISGSDGVNYEGNYSIQYLLTKGYAQGKQPGVNTVTSFQGMDYLTRAEAVQFLRNLSQSGFSQLKERPTEPSPLTSLIGEKVFQDYISQVKEVSKLESSVVMVIGLNDQGKAVSQGSGFAVGNGLFMTNHHVLKDATSFRIITFSQQEYVVEGVAKYDEHKDLAIIKTKVKTNITPLRIGSINTVEKMDRVVAIGSPEGLFNTISEGAVSGIRKMSNQYGETRLIQTTAPVTFGSSGGPLLNLQGEVIGVITFGYETGNLNFAVAIDHGIDWIMELNKKNFDLITTIKTVPVSTTK